MAANQGLGEVDVDPRMADNDNGAPAGNEVPQENNGEQGRQNVQNNNQFGVVRDRLFHAMLIRIALSYSTNVSPFWRRLIEFLSLVVALCLLGLLLFVQIMFSRSVTTCLDHVKDSWPREGVLRVEVIKNLDVLEQREQWVKDYLSTRPAQPTCYFNPALILRNGPASLPAEIRARAVKGGSASSRKTSQSKKEEHSLLSYFLRPYPDALEPIEEDDFSDFTEISSLGVTEDERIRILEEEFDRNLDDDEKPEYEYVAEYSLLYGVLRLTPEYRAKYRIPQVTVRIDAEAACFGEKAARSLMLMAVGYEESVMASLRTLAKNENDNGYIRDLRTNEHFHFVTLSVWKTGYIMAFLVMLLFTFAISMLLRFSHHQIFLFIVDLLHMFELNQPLVFPAAPLLTVILALVGMEAIMSEIFADTTTAFYVILLVWVADQFDAICCHSPISKRHWLRFFYLYQYFFYAYQYRFGGQYGDMALLASTAFIVHSMIFFFHHYELPLILYQERLQRILTDVQHNPRPGPAPVADEREGYVQIQRLFFVRRTIFPSQPVAPENRNENASEPAPELAPNPDLASSSEPSSTAAPTPVTPPTAPDAPSPSSSASSSATSQQLN